MENGNKNQRELKENKAPDLNPDISVTTHKWPEQRQDKDGQNGLFNDQPLGSLQKKITLDIMLYRQVKSKRIKRYTILSPIKRKLEWLCKDPMKQTLEQRKLPRTKRAPSIMIKGSVPQEDITILNASDDRDLEHVQQNNWKEKQTNLQSQLGLQPSPVTHRTRGQAGSTIDQRDRLDTGEHPH